MTWDQFIYFAISAVLLWAAGAFFAFKEKKEKQVYAFTIGGLLAKV